MSKTLKEILQDVDYTIVKGDINITIEDIVIDSRKATDDVAFVCIPGTRVDSHEFIEDVVAAGAKAVVICKDIEVAGDVTVIRVDNPRKTLALMSCAFFDHPTRKMKTIGITGTKGKTTSSHMIKAILEEAGYKVGLIGTNGCDINGEHFKTINTTPESYELQMRFAEMVEAGCTHMVMEVSSQGIMMDRIAGIQFDVGVFTNISPDHIGPNEHSSFEEYLSYKSKIFTMCDVGICNRDDSNFEGMIKGHTCKLYTFSADKTSGEDAAEFTAADIQNAFSSDFIGIEFLYKGLKESYKVKVDIPGHFNVYNALAAISASELVGADKDAVIRALAKVKVAGRMEIACISDKLTVIIDYAHNGVSARSCLETLRAYNPARLVVVFGCGGNRDPHRRYEMGEAVGSMADLSIITEDNSRYEKVEDIIKDIHVGLDKTDGKFVEIYDRREAIKYAICEAQEGDLVAIIGKGHEDYQETCGVRVHLSDKEEVLKYTESL